VTSAAHAFLAPSSASRWGPDGCPGSAAMEAAYSEDDSEAAREGTAAHFAMAAAINGRPVKEGDVDPATGIAMTAEMIECATIMADDVLATLRAAGPGSVLAVEERQPPGFCPENWGTPDAYVFDPANRKLHVFDYKFGHRYVDAFMNWQIFNYAVLILLARGVNPGLWIYWTVTVNVFQPRNYHPAGPVREWVIPGDQINALYGRLSEAAASATTEGAILKTGEHCRDCRARAACPALQRAAMSAVDLSHEQQATDLPPAALGLELVILKAANARMLARITGLEEQILETIKRRVDVPHWRADYSYGRQRWTVPASEVFTLGDLCGVDLRKPVEPVTPREAEKKGIDRTVIQAYSEKPRGVMALVPFDQQSIVKRFL
jgi:hypothetical protein